MLLGDIRYNDGVFTIIATTCPPGLVLAGEIDEPQYAPLMAALDDLPTCPEIHLDLSRVTYCEVTCLRAMVRIALPECTANTDQAAPRLVLRAVPAYLRAALRILGWDKTPGLSMQDDNPIPPLQSP